MLIIIKNIKKGVRNLRFLTTLVPRRHMTATCLIVTAICLPLRQLALYNYHLPLFPTPILGRNLALKSRYITLKTSSKPLILHQQNRTWQKIRTVKLLPRVIVGNKGKWQLYKASCLNGRHIAIIMRQVAVTCRRDRKSTRLNSSHRR